VTVYEFVGGEGGPPETPKGMSLEDIIPRHMSATFYNERNGVEITITFDTVNRDRLIYEPIFQQILYSLKFID